MKSIYQSLALSLLLAGSLISKAAADEFVVAPKGAEEFGSGSSKVESYYSPAGIENVGIFVGHPNNLDRRDRALFKFNLQMLTEPASKIKQARLKFVIDYFHGRDKERVIAVDHFTQEIDLLNGEVVASPDADEVGQAKFTLDDAVAGGTHFADPLVVDVTEALKADVAQGRSSITFRLRDILAEDKGNPWLEATGASIVRPELVVEFKD